MDACGFEIEVNGRRTPASAGDTVAAALLRNGVSAFRHTAESHPRGVFCGMGGCFDCLVTIDGMPDQRACLTPARQGMKVRTQIGRGLAGDDNPQASRDGRALPAEATADVAVVGGGPAGIAAAVTLAELGLNVVLLEEQPTVGGQYLAGHRSDSTEARATPAERRSRELLERLAQLPAEVWTETLVWDLDRSLTLRLCRCGQASTLRARAVILACGGREVTVPFPGWTLPGVTTVGAAQLFAKRFDLTLGKRILLAGSGPLLLATAGELARLGAAVVGVLEATDPRAWLSSAPAVWGQWDRLTEGYAHLRRLRAARVPYRFRRAVVAAHGDERVESVDIARLDAAGVPLADSVERVAVDACCVSFGMTPNVELAQLAGATLTFDLASGGWTPAADERLQTTAPGVFVAGESAAIAGAASALLTGRMAALAVAAYLGAGSESAFQQELKAVVGRLRRQTRFGHMLNSLFAPPGGLWRTVTDDTVVCRCEEVTAGEARTALAEGATSLDALKVRTRVGQGHCQGRTCGPILAHLIAAECGGRVADAGTFSARPPVKPVPLAALAGASAP